MAVLAVLCLWQVLLKNNSALSNIYLIVFASSQKGDTNHTIACYSLDTLLPFALGVGMNITQAAEKYNTRFTVVFLTTIPHFDILIGIDIILCLFENVLCL